MRAEELRIGNLVYNGFKEVIEVNSIREAGISGYNSETINPIPLTEEWLAKFGFSRSDFYYDESYSLNNNEDFEITLWGEVARWSIGIASNIKHVHQLQNLYFALTGEELTIKK